MRVRYKELYHFAHTNAHRKGGITTCSRDVAPDAHV